MKKELREVLDAASKRVAERPDYLLSPDVKAEVGRLREERGATPNLLLTRPKLGGRSSATLGHARGNWGSPAPVPIDRRGSAMIRVSDEQARRIVAGQSDTMRDVLKADLAADLLDTRAEMDRLSRSLQSRTADPCPNCAAPLAGPDPHPTISRICPTCHSYVSIGGDGKPSHFARRDDMGKVVCNETPPPETVPSGVAACGATHHAGCACWEAAQTRRIMGLRGRIKQAIEQTALHINDHRQGDIDGAGLHKFYDAIDAVFREADLL